MIDVYCCCCYFLLDFKSIQHTERACTSIPIIESNNMTNIISVVILKNMHSRSICSEPDCLMHKKLETGALFMGFSVNCVTSCRTGSKLVLISYSKLLTECFVT